MRAAPVAAAVRLPFDADRGFPRMRLSRVFLIVAAVLALGWQVAPERPRIPVQGATRTDWNPASFWHSPWGRSGVHKGIDIFSPLGTAVVAPTYGIVVFTGEIALGGKVVFILGPGWRLHYFAHLDTIAVFPGRSVASGTVLGRIGETGNARGRPPHLHYSILALTPRVWRADGSPQGWKKMFYLDPGAYLP
jgi:murein DD-endopeptidase MepM/ murein hydrolase activator NlpD